MGQLHADAFDRGAVDTRKRQRAVPAPVGGCFARSGAGLRIGREARRWSSMRSPSLAYLVELPSPTPALDAKPRRFQLQRNPRYAADIDGVVPMGG